MVIRLLFMIFTLNMISACASIPDTHSNTPRCSYFSDKSCTQSVPRKIAVFLDGTQNSEKSYTNISTLYNLASIQNRNDIYTKYVQGVGTDSGHTIRGSLFGTGHDERVKEAYRFIAENYRDKSSDEIYLFGFSRGSYSARVTAGLIFLADLPSFEGMSESNKDKLINDIYEIFVSDETLTKKRELIENIKLYSRKSNNVRVSFMGIFDTVPALSYNSNEENELALLSDKYIDQICNIDKVVHAMSLDDNRADSFTPSIMEVEAITKHCANINGSKEKSAQLISSVIDEVWFAGAHSDVGGGYNDSHLSGVPLNWMIRKLVAYENQYKKQHRLLPEGSSVKEDIFGRSHIGEDSILSGLIYKNKTRNIPQYAKAKNPTSRKFVIHSSVIARRAVVPSTRREFLMHPEPGFNPNFKQCFNRKAVDKTLMPNSKTLVNYVLDYNKESCNNLFIIDEPEINCYTNNKCKNSSQ